MKYGKLTILYEDKNRKGYVICKCDCGNVKSIRKTSLTKTKQPTRSCGCDQKKIARQTGLKTIAKNSQKQITTNIAYNTNFQVIENPNLPKNNVSGHKGVSFNKAKNKWDAYINLHGTRIRLGRYKTKAEAIAVREKAEENLFLPLIENKNNT